MVPIRDLGPHHYSVAVRSALHAFVMWIVTQADEVDVEFFQVAKQGGDVLVVVHSATANGGFGIDINALGKDGLAVEKDSSAIDAESRGSQFRRSAYRLLPPS